MMRLWLLALAVAPACGGGPSIIGPEPDVAIQTARCDVTDFGLLSVTIDYRVTIAVGEAFEATVSDGGAGAMPNNSFDCFPWSSTFLGSASVGCERDSIDDPDTTVLVHHFTANLPDTPVSFEVAVLGSALTAPRSDVMIANAGQTVPCTVPPVP